MARPIAIVDNSFLVYSTLLKEVDLLRRLRILFDHLLLPQEVVREFMPKKNLPENEIRHEILGQLSINEGFYRFCNSLDHIVLDSLKSIKNIDLGEAEAIAQSQHRRISFILTDEKKALKNLPHKFSHIRFFNTLTIIAILDLNQFIINYEDCIRSLHRIRKFNSKDVREAYQKAMKFTQRNLSKKDLSKKTSLKRILNEDKL